MDNQPLQLDRADMVSSNCRYYQEDSAAKRVKRLTGQSTVVSEALERVNLRFTLLKREKPWMRRKARKQEEMQVA